MQTDQEFSDELICGIETFVKVIFDLRGNNTLIREALGYRMRYRRRCGALDGKGS